MSLKMISYRRPEFSYWPKQFSDEHSESENFSAVFPEIETRILFFESVFWKFEVRFCGSPTPFDSQEQEDQKSGPEMSRKAGKKSKRDMKNNDKISTSTSPK